ncbi:MAG: hypothetical protein GY800_12615 [Planctomycetes bacterium]|nr:hypothetical protein [Planctomycetota bacterium]
MRYVLIICWVLLISSTAGYAVEENKKDRHNKSTAIEIEAGELKAFARAFMNVQAALEEITEESGEQTYKRTTMIVKNEGLTIKRYTQLTQRMNEDAEFKKAVEEMIQTIKKEQEEEK